MNVNSQEKKLISSEAPVLTVVQIFFDFLKPLENRQLKSQMFTFFVYLHTFSK